MGYPVSTRVVEKKSSVQLYNHCLSVFDAILLLCSMPVSIIVVGGAKLGESGTKDENGANLKQTLLSLRLSPIWGELVQFQANSATLSSPLSTMAVSSSATYPVHLLTSRFSFYDLKNPGKT